MSILAVQTTTFSGYGGIPTYNRLICRVLNETGIPDQSHVLVGTDFVKDVEDSASGLPNLKLEGFSGNRLGLSKRFLSLALTKKFDLTLIGHVNYAPLGLLLKQLQPRMRYGVMLYGVEAWNKLSRLRGAALERADFMISISDYTKQRAVETNNLKKDRIYLLPNALEWIEGVGTDPLLDDPSNDHLVGPSESAQPRPGSARINLLSVCRLDQYERYKGVDKVIEVLSQVAETIPAVEYTVIGDGTDLNRHKALAESLGVSNRVHFLGSVDDQTLRAAYRDCDLFVLPSAGEGFGFVFLEAMKFGKAIVAANSGGAPEVVQDGITGLLVEYGNKEQLAKALTTLCLNQDQRAHLGLAGYQRLQEEFTFPQFKQTLTEILLRELPATSESYLATADTGS
jgi:glycosyltransferase involved in cell wall biosynthesis